MTAWKQQPIGGLARKGFDGAVKALEKLANETYDRPTTGEVIPAPTGSRLEKLASSLERRVNAPGAAARRRPPSGDVVKLAERLEQHVGGVDETRQAFEKAAMLLVAAEAQEKVIQRMRGTQA